MNGPYVEQMRRELGDMILKGKMTREEAYVLTDQLLEKIEGVEQRLDAIEAWVKGI